MKTKEILNYLIVVLVFASIGYVAYIQLKPGIKVYGSDKVIDPFLYETGVFHDTISGIDPNSTSYHISKSQLQSIKLKKMGKILIFTLPMIIVCFLIGQNANSGEDENIIIENDKDLCSVKYENFVLFSSGLEKNLRSKIHINTRTKIEYKIPVITFMIKDVNENWNFYFGIKKEKNSVLYLYCSSNSGEILNTTTKTFDKEDLSIEEYSEFYCDRYLKICQEPKFGLITTHQI